MRRVSELTLANMFPPKPCALEVWPPVFRFHEQPAGREREGQVAAGADVGGPAGRSAPAAHTQTRKTDTNLTSPLPPSATPLHPSRPRVHALRSPGRRFALLHPASPPALSSPPGFSHRSFSQSSTVRSSDRQCLSSSRSLSTNWVHRTRSGMNHCAAPSRSRGRMVYRVKGCVSEKGVKPSMRKAARRGRRLTSGIDTRKRATTRVNIIGVYGVE